LLCPKITYIESEDEMYRETRFQAVCCGKPIAPPRRTRAKVRDDLIAHDLGSYDEWGKFFITVPGDIRSSEVWVEAEKAA
jgi:hypothetical protein